MTSLLKRPLVPLLLILCLIAVGTQMFESPVERELFQAEKFTINGIALGTDIATVVEQLGEPDSKDAGVYEWREGDSVPWTIVKVDDGLVAGVWGRTLQYDGRRFVNGRALADFTKRLGKVGGIEEPFLLEHCGFPTPEFTHTYRYSELGLTLCGRSSGRFWRTPVRIETFLLSRELVPFFLGRPFWLEPEAAPTPQASPI